MVLSLLEMRSIENEDNNKRKFKKENMFVK